MATTNLNDYITSGKRPAAFLGWKTKKVIAVFNEVQTYHPEFIGKFMDEWANNGSTLQDAVEIAGAYGPALGINPSTLRIWGYKLLRYNEFNSN